MFSVEVLTTAGAAGEPEPTQINFDGRQVQVAAVVDRWFGQEYRYFKLRGSDGATYVLRNDERRQVWEVVLYRRQDDNHDRAFGSLADGE